MAGSEIDDPAPPEEPSRAPGHLPRLIQLFTGQTAGVADGATYAVKQARARKAAKVTCGEPSFRGV